MRSLRLAFHAAAAAAALMVSTASASPADPKLGTDYIALAQPQPVQASGKQVEVLEFFMYRCPHCANLEPELEAWAKKQGDNIVLRRLHFPFSGPTDPGAHLFVTLEAMGKSEAMAQKVFDAIHKQHIRLDRDEDVIFDWVGKNGIDAAAFRDTWNSFAVVTRLRTLNRLIDRYKVGSAPTIVVDGKYVTEPARVGDVNRIADEQAVMKVMPAVLDGMVARAKAEKN
ncbi:thiol:disulfide interchange protein DsbA/DsbL [Massilia arenosa]|uniref:Thiol:disulfide interchange protein n=1 Tax=Zemynaea arenosa TaxID=2561931 RepID=A0A4Y9SE88_9BURK|nr:thiol:disulfide interchange protein DsbA/DsbL [Massilia arenosa]TFW21247.1 thiol:disulfide interchange protein DsbA/DsbL [Massilia arenosa]